MARVRIKSPLPKAESYPLKFSEIVAACGSAPQLDLIEVDFFRYETMEKRKEEVRPLLFVSYLLSEKHHTPKNLHAEWNNPRWSISVSPVPRELRSKINGILKNEALPLLEEWLQKAFKYHGQVTYLKLGFSFDYGKKELRIEK
jgi:hypothetical protein